MANTKDSAQTVATALTAADFFRIVKDKTGTPATQIVGYATLITELNADQLGLVAAGDIFYGASGSTVTRLAKGTSTQVLTMGTALPAWSTPPAGSSLQQVNTQTGAVASGTTVMPLDDTIPQNTEGVAFTALDTAITPTSATSKLKIEVVINGANSVANYLIVALFQDSTAGALAANATYMPTAGSSGSVMFTHYMTAGTTSATTFKLRVGCSAAGTTTINGQAGGRLLGGVMASSMTITEIKV